MSGFSMVMPARARTVALAAVSLVMGAAAITLTLGVSDAHAGWCMSLPCVPNGSIEKNIDPGGNAPSGSGWGLPGDSDGDGIQDDSSGEVVFGDGEGTVIEAGGGGTYVGPGTYVTLRPRKSAPAGPRRSWPCAKRRETPPAQPVGFIFPPVGVACRWAYQRLCHAVQRETERQCNSGFGP